MVAKGHGTLSLTLLYSLAGTAGFEPANAGTKTQCLTTWRRPTICQDNDDYSTPARKNPHILI